MRSGTQLGFVASLVIGCAAAAWSADDGRTSREGTKIILSREEVADLQQWVENAKHDLELLQDDTRRGTLEERRDRIIREFGLILRRSNKKENEILIRYTLNRALELDEWVGPDPAPSELQSLVGFLDSTIELAKTFYADDMRYLEAIGRGEDPTLQTPMPLFALQYSERLLAFSRTFIRPELEYRITYAALGWLGNDLNSSRNLARIQYSEAINRIARLQSRFPLESVGDSQKLLKQIREFKWEYRERVLQQVQATNQDIREAFERAERKKREEERLAKLSAAEREAELRKLAERAEAEKRRRDEEAAQSESDRARERLLAEILSRQVENDRKLPSANTLENSEKIREFRKLVAGQSNHATGNSQVELFVLGNLNTLSTREILETWDLLRDPSHHAGRNEDEAVAERIVRKLLETRKTLRTFSPAHLIAMSQKLSNAQSNLAIRDFAIEKINQLTTAEILLLIGALRDPTHHAGEAEDEVVEERILASVAEILSVKPRPNMIAPSGNFSDRFKQFCGFVERSQKTVKRNELIRNFFHANKTGMETNQGTKLIGYLIDPSHHAGALEDEAIAAEIQGYFIGRLSGGK